MSGKFLVSSYHIQESLSQSIPTPHTLRACLHLYLHSMFREGLAYTHTEGTPSRAGASTSSCRGETEAKWRWGVTSLGAHGREPGLPGSPCVQRVPEPPLPLSYPALPPSAQPMTSSPMADTWAQPQFVSLLCCLQNCLICSGLK